MRARKRRHPDSRRPGVTERQRAGVGGGAGGQYVVHQKHPAAANPLRLRNVEGPGDVLPALGGAQARLRGRIAHAHTVAGCQRNLPQSRHLSREQESLVEAAPALASRVKRHRNEHVKRLPLQAPRGFREKPAQRFRQRAEAVVFQPLDERAQSSLIGGKTARLRERKLVAPIRFALNRAAPAHAAIRGSMQRRRTGEKPAAPKALDSCIRLGGVQTIRADGGRSEDFQRLFTDAADGREEEGEERVPRAAALPDTGRKPNGFGGGQTWFEDGLLEKGFASPRRAGFGLESSLPEPTPDYWRSPCSCFSWHSMQCRAQGTASSRFCCISPPQATQTP